MNTVYAAAERLLQKEDYCYTPPTLEEQKRQREECSAWGSDGIVFSIALPCYETPRQFLIELLDSVRDQSYPGWELVLADAGDRTDDVKHALEQWMEREENRSAAEKIRYIKLDQNKGISENTNAAIEAASGDYICLMDHDDLLTPDALFYMAKAILSVKEKPYMVYSDEDKTNTDTTRFYEPNIKDLFNYDLILSNNYVCHLMAVRADLMKELMVRAEYDGAQDFDLVLRIAEKAGIPVRDGQILHVPRVLYHWRCHPGSTASNTDSKLYAYEAGRRAVEDHLKRRNIDAKVEHSRHLGFYNTCYGGGIFMQRSDVGAVCGRILDPAKRMKRSIRGEGGAYLYVGLFHRFSGNLNRFAMAQQVMSLDIRAMRLREELQSVAESFFGMPYSERGPQKIWDWKAYEQKYRREHQGNTPNWSDLNDTFSNMIREQGYRIVYRPELETVTWSKD